MKSKRVAVLGAGAWGKNHVRTFDRLAGDAGLYMVIDPNQKVLDNLKRDYPRTRFTTRLEDVVEDPDVDAVVVASPVPTHGEMTRRMLEAGKHVLVEKPMVRSHKEALELVELAEEKNLRLMVGHLLLYHPATSYLKQMVESNELGEIYYAYSHRLNLGKVRPDENAMWSFAPHDLSVILYLFDESPVMVSATGASFLQKGIQDVSFLNLQFASGRVANVHVSWLDPHRSRFFTVVGSQKMVVFDDTHATEKIRVYDKGIDVKDDYKSFGEYLALRHGDVNLPLLSSKEPLREECLHFLSCIESGARPLTDGRSTLEIIRVLEAADESMQRGGVPISLTGDSN